MHIYHKLIVSALSVAILSGCATENVKPTTKTQADDVVAEEVTIREYVAPSESYVEESNEMYLGSIQTKEDKIEYIDLPDVFNEKIAYDTNGSKPLLDVLAGISSNIYINVRLTPHAMSYVSDRLHLNKKDSEIKMNINYYGQVKNLLTDIASDLGLYWEYDKEQDQVVFKYYRTEIFELNQPTAQTNSSVTMTNKKADASTLIESTYEAQNDGAWDQSIMTIESMVGEIGTVKATEKTGIIVVRTSPMIMEDVSEYVSQVNQNTNEKIAYKISAYKLPLNTYTSNLKWNELYQDTKSKLNWQEVEKSPYVLSNGNNIEIISAKSIVDDNPFASAEILEDAIMHITGAEYSFGFVGYTTNKRPSLSNDSQEKTYDTTVSKETDGTKTVEKIESKSVTTGYWSYVYPTILENGSTMLDFTLSFKEPVDVIDPTNGHKSPVINEYSFTQSFPLKPGQTAIISKSEGGKLQKQQGSKYIVVISAYTKS